MIPFLTFGLFCPNYESMPGWIRASPENYIILSQYWGRGTWAPKLHRTKYFNKQKKKKGGGGGEKKKVLPEFARILLEYRENFARIRYIDMGGGAQCPPPHPSHTPMPFNVGNCQVRRIYRNVTRLSEQVLSGLNIDQSEGKMTKSNKFSTKFRKKKKYIQRKP